MSYNVSALIYKRDSSNKKHIYGRMVYTSPDGDNSFYRFWGRFGCRIYFGREYADSPSYKKKLKNDGYKYTTVEELGSHWEPIKTEIEHFLLIKKLKGY